MSPSARSADRLTPGHLPRREEPAYRVEHETRHFVRVMSNCRKEAPKIDRLCLRRSQSKGDDIP